MSVKVTVIIQISSCNDRDCWCTMSTDKHGKPLPLRRDLPMASVPVALAGVELDGHRGHAARAWVDATQDVKVQATRKARSDYQPLARSGSWVTTPRKVRASSGRWRGENQGSKWERKVIAMHTR